MNVQRTAPAAFTAEFESEEEVRREHEANLAFGALSLPTAEIVDRDAVLSVTLRGPFGGEITVRCTAVASLSGAIALAVEGDPDEMRARLLEKPEEAAPVSGQGMSQNPWDRVRALSQVEKILLAPKAERTERAVLLQDNDPRVLLSVLRNPRLMVDEVVRVAKSSFLTYQLADVIMQSTPWKASLEVRLGLIHNPKTPQAFALRILPTLPDSEVRAVARAGTSMALKQAALRRLSK